MVNRRVLDETSGCGPKTANGVEASRSLNSWLHPAEPAALRLPELLAVPGHGNFIRSCYPAWPVRSWGFEV